MKRRRAFVLAACIAAGPMLTGCGDVVLTNVVAGLQDGAISTATGIINAVFDQRFPVDTSTDAGGGDGSFVQL